MFLTRKRAYARAGLLGNPSDGYHGKTLSFSVLSGVRSMNEVFPLDRAVEAYERMVSGKARFRVVLTTGN